MGAILTYEEVEKLELAKGYSWRIEGVCPDLVVVKNDNGNLIFFDIDKNEIRSELIKARMSFDQSVLYLGLLSEKTKRSRRKGDQRNEKI